MKRNRLSIFWVTVFVVTVVAAGVWRGAAAQGEKRVALVIGNSAYLHAPALPNPRKDAEAVAVSLRRLGFSQVIERHDLTQANLLSELRAFGDSAVGADWAVVFYAGHGMQVDGQNYLIPVDARLKRVNTVEDETAPLERVLSKAREARKLRLVILDACRDNPFSARMEQTGRKRTLGRGLARVEPESGELIAYAARDGQQAADGDGAHSPFTAALLANIEQPGVEVNLLFRKVRGAVLASTGRNQEPFVYGSLPEEQFYFNPPAQGAAAKTPDEVAALKEKIAKMEQQVAALSSPLAKPPVESAVKPAVGRWPEQSGPKVGETIQDCADCPEMVVVPAGSFMMGSPPDEPERFDWEGPQRRVTIARPFAVGKDAVTFAQWDTCVADRGCGGYKPPDAGWGRGPRPVINVSWDDAQGYVKWLSRKTGQTYRLPSEAEREYFTRARTSTLFWWGSSITPFWWGSSITPDQANYNGSADPYNGGGKEGVYRRSTVPVKSFKPNAWGLYQVHGNVWEWTEDCWNGNHDNAPADGSARTTRDCSRRVVRGGAWNFIPRYLRAAYRDRDTTDSRVDYGGFRVVRTLNPAS